MFWFWDELSILAGGERRNSAIHFDIFMAVDT